ncbi:MAG: hypothetical protein AAGD06_32400 [Acidobacteriota bacterium]
MVEAAGLREKLSARVTRVAPHYRRYEGLVRAIRKDVPTSRGLLAKMHRGEVITRVSSAALTGLAIGFLVLGIAIWLLTWGQIFHQLVRWTLIAAFVGQVLNGVLLLLVFRISLLRAEHLRLLPWSRFVALRAAAVWLRWFADAIFLLALGRLISTVLTTSITAASGLLSAFDSPLLEKLGLITLPLAALWLVVALVIQIVCYSLAAAIETLISIEQNTRGPGEGRQPIHGEITTTGKAMPQVSLPGTKL